MMRMKKASLKPGSLKLVWTSEERQKFLGTVFHV